MTDGKKVMVKETVDEVVDSIVVYKERVRGVVTQGCSSNQAEVTYLRVEES